MKQFYRNGDNFYIIHRSIGIPYFTDKNGVLKMEFVKAWRNYLNEISFSAASAFEYELYMRQQSPIYRQLCEEKEAREKLGNKQNLQLTKRGKRK